MVQPNCEHVNYIVYKLTQSATSSFFGNSDNSKHHSHIIEQTQTPCHKEEFNASVNCTCITTQKKTPGEPIFAISERKLKKTKCRESKRVGCSRWRDLLTKNVKAYILHEVMWEDLQWDSSASEDDRWSDSEDKYEHINTSPEPPTLEFRAVLGSKVDTEPSIETEPNPDPDHAVQSEANSSTTFYEDSSQTAGR